MPTDYTAGTDSLDFLNNEITRTLIDLGLTEEEARVLLFLNKNGKTKVQEIAKNTEIPRTRLYYILQNLENKGVVFSTMERPVRYNVLPLEKAVDFLINTYRSKLRSLENAREVISNNWSLLQKYEAMRNSEAEVEKDLQTIVGEDVIYSKVKSLETEATKEVKIFANIRNLTKMSHADIINFQMLTSNGIVVKILTNVRSCDPSLMDEINGCQIKEIPPHFNDTLCFIVVDNKKLLVLNLDKIKKVSGMWTTSEPFVDAMNLLFSLGWHQDGVQPNLKAIELLGY